jgi:hypothetical protein
MLKKDAPGAELKKRSTPEIRAYLKNHPDCTFEELTGALSLSGLSKPWFYSLRSQARARAGAGIQDRSIMKVEILDSIDSSGFSEAIRDHYKKHLLPLLKRILPDGPTIQMVHHCDPPRIEIRKVVG